MYLLIKFMYYILCVFTFFLVVLGLHIMLNAGISQEYKNRKSEHILKTH